MAIFAEVTENERIIDRHLRDIYPLLDYDRLKVSLYAVDLIEIGLQHYMALVQDPDFNIMQQSHDLLAIAELLVSNTFYPSQTQNSRNS